MPSTSPDAPLPCVLVLASGRGERFRTSGGQVHKLAAMLEDRSVLEHTLAAVRASGLPWHLEDAGHPGMGDSIAAAVRATPEAAGWLVLPGDLPLVQAGTLRAIAVTLASGAEVVAPVFGGQRGHPVGFAAALGPQLMALTGEQGASVLLRAAAQRGALLSLPVEDCGVVTDIDTLADLERAASLLRARCQAR
ncbi:MAG: nucleotidyltransferase family protein [Burkholderiaceae bacterium]|nr:nucleotidyltransferase family protein [Burkholderiaceae bacterium]MCO5104109.1 nucleotidyltransferase family protein [Burkholderiaceae bacterium]